MEDKINTINKLLMRLFYNMIVMNRNKKTYQPKVIVLFLLLIFTTEISSQNRGVESPNRLFHIERSKNRNLVCYDVNLSEGVLDLKQPLDIYWVNQEENLGEIKGLSGIQKRLAYGYKIVSKGDDTCKITLTAYSERELTIRREADRYICIITINNQPCILQKLYVKAKESNSLSVEYVELTGRSISSGEKVTEKVVK